MASDGAQVTKAKGNTTWLVILVGLSVLLNYVDRGAIGVAAPMMKSELSLSATAFGFAVSAFFWVYVPINLLIGWLCDRFCVYRVFALGLGLWALSTFLTGWVWGFATLVTLRLLLGLGEAIAFPGSSKIFASEVPSHHRGMANALVAAGLAFGPAVGTLAGGTILGMAGWRPIFWIFGAVTLLWLIPWQAVSRPFRGKTFLCPAVEPVPFGQLLRQKALWLMGAAHFMSSYGFYFLLTWLPLFLVETRGYSVPEMTLVATTGFTAQGVASLVIGRASDMLVARGVDEAKLRRQLMAFGQLALGVSMAGIFLVESALAVTGWLVIAGIAIGAIATNVFAVGQMFGGPRSSGAWVGVQNTLGNFAGITGPLITGITIDYLGGYGWAFAVAGGVSALGFIWWLFVIPEIREVGS